MAASSRRAAAGSTALSGGRGRIRLVTVSVDDEAIAEPRPCVRCSRLALLSVVGRCADCISEMGRDGDSADYQEWKSDVRAEFGRK
jgi:hypothetical protein